MDNHFESNFEQVKNSILKYFMFFWVLTGIGMAIRPLLPEAVVFAISMAVLAIVLVQFVSSFFTEVLYKSFILNSTVALFFGVVIHTLIQKYVSAMGGEMVTAIVFTAVAVFVVLGVVGMKVKTDLSGFYNYLWAFCLGMFVASIFGIVFGIGTFMQTLLAGLGFGLFSLFTLVEFNMIAKGYASKKEAHVWGYNLYLNLLNMILDLLRLVYNLFYRE